MHSACTSPPRAAKLCQATTVCLRHLNNALSRTRQQLATLVGHKSFSAVRRDGRSDDVLPLLGVLRQRKAVPHLPERHDFLRTQQCLSTNVKKRTHHVF